MIIFSGYRCSEPRSSLLSSRPRVGKRVRGLGATISNSQMKLICCYLIKNTFLTRQAHIPWKIILSYDQDSVLTSLDCNNCLGLNVIMNMSVSWPYEFEDVQSGCQLATGAPRHLQKSALTAGDFRLFAFKFFRNTSKNHTFEH